MSNIKNKTLLFVMFAFFAIGCTTSKKAMTNKRTAGIEDFAGYWLSESEIDRRDYRSLRLTLNIEDAKENTLTGLHWALIRGGNQVDYPDNNQEPAIHGRLRNDTVYLYFVNAWDDEVEAKLYFDKSDNDFRYMIWELIRYEPKVVSFFPQKDTLRSLSKPQIIAPNETVPKNKVKRSQNTVTVIREMALRVDTLNYYPEEENISELLEFIYYDDDARIRKYYWKDQIHDGSHEESSYEAYYDEEGKLVYISYSAGSNCEDACEEFWVHNGKIVDFKAALYCGCCENTNDILSEEEVNLRRPKIGDKLIQTITWEVSLTGFRNTVSLLQLLDSEDRHGAFILRNVQDYGNDL